jgi:hypothetical protein
MKPSSISLWSISLLALAALPTGAVEAGWRDRVIIEDGWYDVPRPPRPVGGYETYDDDTYADPAPGPDLGPEPGYGDDDPSLGQAPDEIDPEEVEPGGDYDGEYESQRTRLNTQAARPRRFDGEAGPAVVPGLAPGSSAKRRTTLLPDDEVSQSPRTRPAKARSAKIDPSKSAPSKRAPSTSAPSTSALSTSAPSKSAPAKFEPVRSARAKPIDPVGPRTVPAATPPKPAPAKVVDEPQTTAAVGKPLPEMAGAKPVLGARAAGVAPVTLPVKRPIQEVLDCEETGPGPSLSGERR